MKKLNIIIGLVLAIVVITVLYLYPDSSKPEKNIEPRTQEPKAEVVEERTAVTEYESVDEPKQEPFIGSKSEGIKGGDSTSNPEESAKGELIQVVSDNDRNNITVNIHKVMWPSLDAVNNAIYDELSASAQKHVSVSPVPVLVPNSPALAIAALVTIGQQWYAASIPQKDITILVSATNVSHTVPNIKVFDHQKDHVRGVPALITQNVGILSISWNEFGVAYVLEIDCRLSEDSRCTDDAYARELTESLVFVGGAR